MGYHYRCGSCDFEFVSGYSFAERSSDAICSRCATEFVLPMRGRGPGDLIELLRVVRTENRRNAQRKLGKLRTTFEPTHQFVMLDGTTGNTFEFVGLAELICVSCRGEGSYVVRFEENASCPKCSVGKLSGEVVDIG